MTELKALWNILKRNRASSLVANAMMGIAVAVAATTFALADAALFRQLPFRNPEELLALVTTHPTLGEFNISLPDLPKYYKRASPSETQLTHRQRRFDSRLSDSQNRRPSAHT